MEENEYSEFIIADNDTEVANGDSNEEVETLENTNEVETETEVTAEPTADVETEKTKEYTETQRVSQRINEARQQAKDEVIANMGYEWNGKQITTEAQYKQAMAEQAEQQRNAELEAQGIDPKYLNDAIANNPDIRAAKELLAQQSTQRQQQQIFNDFIAKFPDVKNEQISNDTWKEVNEGSTLVDAYTRQENRELKEKLKVYTQNESNKKKAPVTKGINTHGSDEVASEDDFMAGFNSVR